MVEFVSYDGEFPNLCAGTLILRINGEERKFPPHSLISGGCILSDYEVEEGEWSVEIPEDLVQYEKEITECVNDNVPWGCCGGCI